MEFKYNEAKTWLDDENGKQIAVLDHPEVRPGVVCFTHTFVDDCLRGQGVAGKITQAAVDRLKEEGKKIELTCSYSIKWFAKHPEYTELLADPEAEAEKARQLAGPACGVKQ